MSFLESYVEYASGRTNAPPIFHQLAALAICAAALGDRVYVRAGFRPRVYPALWLCLVGSSLVAKSSALGVASNLLEQASEDAVLPEDFSREALVEHLSRRSHGLLRWSEIGVALESFAKDYNRGVLSTLTDIWDSRPKITRLTKSAGLVTIEYPALTILAAGKPRWFLEFIKPKQIGGGFIGRWLFSWEDRANGYLSIFGREGYGGDSERYQRESLVAHLAQLAHLPETHIQPGEGGKRIDDWAATMEGKWDSDDEDPAEFSKRASEQVLKLTMAIQAAQSADLLEELHPKAAEQAIELWRYLYECGKRLVAEIAGQSVDKEEIQRVWRVIAAARRIRQRDLLRRTHLTLNHLVPMVETLIAQGRIRADREDPEVTTGPPTTWYVALE